MNKKSKVRLYKLWFDKITIKKISILLIIIYFISLIPLLILSHYNFPSADDFSFTAPVRQVWIESGSLPQTVWAVFTYSGYHYLNWTGTFVTSVLGMLQPSVFGEQYTAWNAYLIIGALSISVYLLAYVMLIKICHADKYLALIPPTVYLLLAVQHPISGVEAFYWYTGAATYMYPLCFALLFFSCLGGYLGAATGNKKTIMLFLITLLEGLIGLGTYLIALNFLIINITIVILLYLNHRKKECKLFLIPFCVYIISFLANICAPGNQFRIAGASGHSPLKAILISFSYAIEYPTEKWMDVTLIAAMLLLIPFLYKIASGIKFDFPYPVLVVIYSYCLFAALFTPPLAGGGSVDAGRLQNQMYYIFLLLLIVNLFYILGWIHRKLYQAGYTTTNKELSKNGKVFVLTVAAFLVFGTLVIAIPSPNKYSASAALSSLMSGEAASYRAEMEERMVQLHDEHITDAEFKPLSARPFLIYFSDIKTDSEDWENKAMSRYYGKNSVVIKE